MRCELASEAISVYTPLPLQLSAQLSILGTKICACDTSHGLVRPMAMPESSGVDEVGGSVFDLDEHGLLFAPYFCVCRRR